MAKFNTKTPRARAGRGPIATATVATGKTGEGAPGYARADAKSELFLLAVANMVGEKTFYEDGSKRDARYENLVRQVAIEDPVWTAQFLRWLRGEGNMRSASLVGALEFVKARLDAKMPTVPAHEVPGFISDRGIERVTLDAVLQRADEPGEALAYWLRTHGRNIPKSVKRGISDAVWRLYNEYTLLKYDTASHGMRFGDVLSLVHPTGTLADSAAQQPIKGTWRADLYQFALDRRHGNDSEIPASLLKVSGNKDLREQLARDPKFRITPELLQNTGMTWEDILSLLGNRVDKKVLWEALIPVMGIMALIRNVRNFDQAGVSDAAVASVIARLQDPEQIAKSRQFPFRFLAALQAAQSPRWSYPLEQALTHSVSNIPELPGRTLVLVDRSGSMFGTISEKSGLNRADAAAVFGAALALRNSGRVTLVQFGSRHNEIKVPKGAASLLALIKQFGDLGGTYTQAATRAHYAQHDRVIVITDEQSYDGDPGDVIPASVPLYTWNLAGYEFNSAKGGPNRHVFGGLTDQAFRLIPLLEAGKDGSWPWDKQQ